MVFLLRDVEQNKKDIARLKQQVAETNQLCANVLSRFSESANATSTSATKFMLKVENVLLRFERQLPPARETKKPK